MARGIFDTLIVRGRSVLKMFDAAETRTSGVPDGTIRLYHDTTNQYLQTFSLATGTWETFNPSSLVAPSDADYLVGTATAALTGEIVAGATPGGELGGTWPSPIVDATHSGSAHHAAVHVLEGSDDTEQTTASTGDLNTVTGLSVSTTRNVVVDFDFRTAIGSASPVRVNLKINATDLGVVGITPGVNETISGHVSVTLGPRDDANYLGNFIPIYTANGTATATSGIPAGATTQPNSIITSATANVSLNAGSRTVGIANLRVYSL